MTFVAQLIRTKSAGVIQLCYSNRGPNFQTAARLLGVQADDLVESFTTSKVSARGEVISKANNVAESRQAVNSLAMGLYSRLIVHSVLKWLLLSHLFM